MISSASLSVMSSVRRSSMGSTILPSSSTRLTIPVAFTCGIPPIQLSQICG